MKYKLKNPPVTAIQWDATEDTWKKILELVGTQWDPGPMGSNTFFINPPFEPPFVVNKGDYVVKTHNGAVTVYEPNKFHELYEPTE